MFRFLIKFEKYLFDFHKNFHIKLIPIKMKDIFINHR